MSYSVNQTEPRCEFMLFDMHVTFLPVSAQYEQRNKKKRKRKGGGKSPFISQHAPVQGMPVMSQ